MNQHLNGIFGLVICVVVMTVLMGFRKKLRPILDKQIFWVIFSSIWIVYFLGARYIPYIVQSFNAKEGTVAHGMLYQNAFMTNVCPMATMTIAIGSMFRRFRERFGPSIAAVAMFGGILNMIGIAMSKQTENFFSFIFFKTTVSYTNPQEHLNNYLWYMTHLVMIIQAIFLFMICRKFTWKHVMYMYIWTVSFFMYVAMIMFATGIRHDVAGLWINDWIKYDNYEGVFIVIGNMYWPSETHGWESVVKAMVGVGLLNIAGWSVVGLAAYFINFENNHKKMDKIKEKINFKSRNNSIDG